MAETKDTNTGTDNSGDWNSGNRNSGYKNSGDWNSGDWNSGDWNSGDWNSGYKNSGDRNSGNWNSGDWNSGDLNSEAPTVRLFNKDTGINREDWNISFPDFFYFEQVKWIESKDMSDSEKESNPTHTITGGYLKVIEYQEAWRESWDKASDEDRRKVLTLPNWNNEVFKEISGIDVEKALSISPKPIEDEIVLNGVRYKKID